MNMKYNPGRNVRLFATSVLAASAMVVGLSGTAVAQNFNDFNNRTSIFIDGSTPVDARTKALVDAHFDQIRDREQAKAEERQRLDRFIYHDNTFGAQQSGRW